MRLSVPALALCLTLSTPLFAQQTTLPLWPSGTPEPAHTSAPEHNLTRAQDPTLKDLAGRPVLRTTDVAIPTLAFYPAPTASNTHTAALVFPGGGYQRLSMDAEGTEVCAWLNSLDVNCLLFKYRVPEAKHFPESTEDLEDAQQAIRLARLHAAEWHLDPHRLGAIGFSAGAHLAVVLGNHPDLEPLAAALKGDARPDFAMAIYPGYLTDAPALTGIARGIDPSPNTPPTFLLQAENDPVHVENALNYFKALKDLHVPAELHTYAEGGHGYGLRSTDLPITHWPTLAATWLHTIHILP